MEKVNILPTNNQDWGLWGTCIHNDYNPQMTWEAVSRFMMKEFDLTPEQTRDVLDARFGRHLADDLSNVYGIMSETNITTHLKLRMVDKKWRNSYEKSITEETGKVFPYKAPISKNELFSLLAECHLGIETLVTRNSDGLDFHDVPVWGVKAALEAAYEAGRKAEAEQR